MKPFLSILALYNLRFVFHNQLKHTARCTSEMFIRFLQNGSFAVVVGSGAGVVAVLSVCTRMAYT